MSSVPNTTTMETTFLLNDRHVKKDAPVTLLSPRIVSMPPEVVFLSNIDQTVAFPVETVFFYPARDFVGTHPTTFDIVDRVRKSAAEVLLVPYYFMAGRLDFNAAAKRLELVCNNAGVLFVGASSELELEELGDLSLPNPSFRRLIVPMEGFLDLSSTPIFTIQVTKFKCGGFSIGFVTNHSVLDGRSATAMFEHLAAACRGEIPRLAGELNIDRSCVRARDPPQIKFCHSEYAKPSDASPVTSFTSPDKPSPPPALPTGLGSHRFKMFALGPDAISRLKSAAATKCSSFEAVVAHLWQARTRAVFDDPSETSSVLFAVDIRPRMSPPLPQGFVGNAVISASASARVADLVDGPLGFGVERVREGMEKVTDEYVRSVIDWLEVHKGVPSTMKGKNFYLSAWWKLPFHELDFGYGRPVYAGPVVGGMDEFVLLLADGSGGGGVKVWISLVEEKMEKFSCYVHDI